MNQSKPAGAPSGISCGFTSSVGPCTKKWAGKAASLPCDLSAGTVLAIVLVARRSCSVRNTSPASRRKARASARGKVSAVEADAAGRPIHCAVEPAGSQVPV